MMPHSRPGLSSGLSKPFMNVLQFFAYLDMLRALVFAFSALGAVGCPLLGGKHVVVKKDVDFAIFEHEHVIIKGEVQRDIDAAGTRHAIGTSRATDLQHFPVGLPDFADQSKFL